MIPLFSCSEEASIKTSPVKTIAPTMCSAMEQEINCIKKALLERDKATYQDDVSQCHTEALKNSGGIVKIIKENISSESERKEILSQLTKINIKYELDRRDCRTNNISLDSMLDCYDMATDSYLNNFKAKFCPNQ